MSNPIGCALIGGVSAYLITKRLMYTDSDTYNSVIKPFLEELIKNNDLQNNVLSY